MEVGNQNNLTIALAPDERLMNGDTYFAVVTACNAAGMCTHENSSEIVIDHTPPHIGNLQLPLKWSNVYSNVSVSWSGFVDAESDIGSYHIGIGQTYSGYELSNGIIDVAYSTNVQSVDVQITRNLVVGERIFISIDAENNAGLVSPIGKSCRTCNIIKQCRH